MEIESVRLVSDLVGSVQQAAFVFSAEGNGPTAIVGFPASGTNLHVILVVKSGEEEKFLVFLDVEGGSVGFGEGQMKMIDHQITGSLVRPADGVKKQPRKKKKDKEKGLLHGCRSL